MQFGGALLGGLFGGGGKPKIPKELRRIYKFQMQLADQQRRFAQSTPLSTPEEQAYLGQARGELGEQLTQQREQLGSLYNPLTMGRNAPNQLLNLGNQQIGQQMNLQAQALLSAYQQRRQALSQASGMAANAAGAVSYQQQPQTDLAGTFGGLARAIAMQRGMQQGQYDQNLSNFIGATPAPSVSPTPLGPPAPATTQGAERTFNPVAQVGGLQLPGSWNNVGPAAVQQPPLGGSQGSNAGQMGWNFADPRRRQFIG